MVNKKWKINKVRLSALFMNIVRYAFLFMLSVILFLGYEVYKDLSSPTTFQSWVFLIIAFLGICLVFWGVFTWRTIYPLGSISYLLLFIGLVANTPECFSWSSKVFLVAIIYELLTIFGLQIKLAFFWRGGRVS